MNKEELKKIIGEKIQEVTHEYLRELNNQKKIKSTNDFVNSSNISEEEFDNAFFHGGGKPNTEKKISHIIFKEGAESNLKITTSEIKDFENSFGEIMENIPGASIVFNKQNNGYTIAAVKRPDGVEAKASGAINMGYNGKIIWSYSILNGFNINAQNVKLNQSNKTMFEALTNHYDDWQKKWREKLNLPTAATTQDGGAQPNNTSLPPMNQNAPGVSGGAGLNQAGGEASPLA